MTGQARRPRHRYAVAAEPETSGHAHRSLCAAMTVVTLRWVAAQADIACRAAIKLRGRGYVA
jgi:hypothetical protein